MAFGKDVLGNGLLQGLIQPHFVSLRQHVHAVSVVGRDWSLVLHSHWLCSGGIAGAEV